jgi:hypothetical protein
MSWPPGEAFARWQPRRWCGGKIRAVSLDSAQSPHPPARLPGDDARDVIALVEAVDRQDCDGMSAILHSSDELGLTVGLAVLCAHLLREIHGDDISGWLASHRRAALAMDNT